MAQVSKFEVVDPYVEPLQPAALDVYATKYQLKAADGAVIDKTMYDTFKRVAKALAGVEAKEERGRWEKQFLHALLAGAIPAGRIVSNAGAGQHKPKTSLINCLAGETPVLTRRGLIPIRDLAGRKVEVVNGNGRWAEVEFKSFGVQPVYTLDFTYADNQQPVQVRATADHRWFMMDGTVITTEFWLSNGNRRRKGFTKIPHLFTPEFDVNGEEYEMGVLHGAVYGDGSQHHTHPDQYTLALFGNKQELVPLIAAVSGDEPVATDFNGNEALRFNHIVSAFDLKSLPVDYTPSYLRGFFAGLLATDGSVYSASGQRTTAIAIYGTRELVDFLEAALPVVGIVPTRKRRDFCRGDVTNLWTRQTDVWRLVVHPSTVREEDILRSAHREHWYPTDNGAARSQLWTFRGIHRDAVMEEVFCCHEPETTAFCILNGMKTGQCTVSQSITDSMEGIGGGVANSLLTLAAGCGIGYEFSTLRPKGGFINGVGATTSGPLSFMDIYDKACFTVASAGGRRGAQMATFDVRHPDIEEFITAKRENGRLRQFNCSVLVTDEFLQAVDDDAEWALRFPAHKNELPRLDPADVVADYWHVDDPNYVPVDDGSGKVWFKVYRRVPARHLWDTITALTYEFSEPGIILIDRVNQLNNNYFCEDIRTSNPCGEQPLPPHGACLLGSINVAKLVVDPFTPQARFDWKEYDKLVATFTRMLDNVVEMNGLPLAGQREEIERKRRHGMGVTGVGSALNMLAIAYGSPASVKFTETLMRNMTLVGYRTGLELAQEKGPAPIMHETFTVTPRLLAQHPQLQEFEVGTKVAGRELWCHSRFMLQVKEVDEALWQVLREHGCRFTHHTSIAPTGTISVALCNNVSNGIEPTFAHSYKRNIVKEGKKSKLQVDMCSYEWLLYQEAVPDAALPATFLVADDLEVEDHVKVQGAAQKWTDGSISKTINVPHDMNFEEFKSVYELARHHGLKGCCTFRFNPEAFSGVLVREDDLKNTTYEVELEGGEKMSVAGDALIEYDGEVHQAANLFDALKEGYYGRF